MINISATYTRPSVSVPWHYEVIDMTAVDALSQSNAWTGKHQAKTIQEILAPGVASTTLTAEKIWGNEADFNAFKATPEYQAYAAARDAYNSANGITASAETITTI